MLAQYIREKGRQQGRQEQARQSLIGFVREARRQGVPAETIAKIVKMDLSAVRKILNHEAVEIPLHLLDSHDR